MSVYFVERLASFQHTLKHMFVMTAMRDNRKQKRNGPNMSWIEFNYGWLQLFIVLSIWGIDG